MVICFTRDIPEPSLPPGISHKLASNYYYTRDGRRESQPPKQVVADTTAKLESGEATEGLVVNFLSLAARCWSLLGLITSEAFDQRTFCIFDKYVYIGKGPLQIGRASCRERV